MDAAPPIAVYTENRYEARREFRLFTAEIHIRVHDYLVGNHTECTVPRGTLRPKPDRMWLRHRLYPRFLAAGVIAAAVAAFSLVTPGFSDFTRIIGTALGGICAISCGILAACCWPRVEWAQFVNDGGVIVLNIAAAGYERGQFPRFIDELVKAIEAARPKPLSTS